MIVMLHCYTVASAYNFVIQQGET